MKQTSEAVVSLTEVKHILEKKEKEYNAAGVEFLYEQRRALDHARACSKLNLKDTKALIKELTKLDLNLTEDKIVKIADILPEDVDAVRAIFAKERFRYEEADIKKIIDVVDHYR